MARDPNELKYPESPKDTPDDLKKLPKPPGIPDAELYGGNYYAIVKIYQNGRRVVEWYKRGTGTPGAPTPDDPVQATSEDVMPTVKEEWDKGEQKEAGGVVEGDIRGPQTGPTREVYRGGKWVPEPNPVYQNPTAPGKATVGRVEGTPIPEGGFDNTKPIWVERDDKGQQVGPAKPLTADQRQQWEREKNPGGKTDAEARAQKPGRKSEPVTGHPGYYEVTTTDPENNKSETHYEDAQGTRVEKLPPTEAEAERNRPKPQQAPDGSWGYFDTSKPGAPPTWVAIPNGPQVAPKPVQVNGQWGVWQPDPKNPQSPPSFVTIEVPKPGVTLKNVDEWQPDFADPSGDLGLGKWAVRQRQKIGLPAEQGGITQDDYDNAVKEAHGRAGTTITNVTNATSVVRQQGLDAEGIRRTRSEEASSDFSTALGMFGGLVKTGGFDPNSGSLKQVIPGLLWEMNKSRREREAQAPSLPGLHPMFQIAAANNAANAHPPAASEQAATTGPSPVPYQPPGAPNAQDAAAQAEAERQRAMATVAPPMPGAPAVAAPPPGAAVPAISAPAMAAPRMPTPAEIHGESSVGASMLPDRSNPSLGQPGDPTGQVLPPGIPGAIPGASPIPSDMPPGYVPPAAPTTDPTVSDPNYQQPQYPPYQYNVVPGGQPYPQQDQGDTQSKVMPGGGPLTSFANGAMGSSQPPAPAEGAGPLDSLAQAPMGGGFDPVEQAARLVAMGAPREAVIQALAQSGLLQRGMRSVA